jgi:fatty-acyl-CoA synthase
MRGGWMHTGDAAVVHADGYVEIRDRFKDVIISGGENISSIEVEGILLKHPAVLEAAVIGVPDEKWGECPHAFVVLKPGASVPETELKQFARNHMAHFKVPAAFTILDELPKTATGKIQKFLLRGGRRALSVQPGQEQEVAPALPWRSGARAAHTPNPKTDVCVADRNNSD